MAVQFVIIRITFLLLLTYGLAEAAPPIGKPSCKTVCGRNVTIPYPFGMGSSNCYMDDWFEIVCNGSGAFLKRINMEVLEIVISSDDPDRSNTVRVKSPIIFSNCEGKRNGATVNLEKSPFVFSYSLNMFTAIGCDNFATLTGIEPMVVGCESGCKGSNISEAVNSSGFNCCQSTIPWRLTNFSATFRSIDFEKPVNKCRSAFIVDQQWFQSNITDPSSMGNEEYAPVVLDWAIYNWNNNSRGIYESMWHRSEVDIVHCYVANGTYYYDDSISSIGWNFSQFFCECGRGYEGNPYLPMGCEGKLQITHSFDFQEHSHFFLDFTT
jgi:hypothetical protein